MSIRPLPEDVVGKIRSSSTVTSLNGVVCGLLKNSLDAGATKVNIYVEYDRGNCNVEDNGLGITPGDFAEDGGLGKPYCMKLFLASPDRDTILTTCVKLHPNSHPSMGSTVDRERFYLP